MSDKFRTVASLQLIAAVAAKAAMDVQNGRLWPGDLAKMVEQIQNALRDVKDAP